MGITQLVLIAVGLSMDAFAVAICKGLNMTKINYKHCFLIALFFGGFQGLMPFIGWLVGTQFAGYITSFDHWIAFGLLLIIGSKMIYDAFQKDDCGTEKDDSLPLRELLILAIATSIDALAMGVTFALVPNTNILTSVLLIGFITFGLSFVGVMVGNRFGSKFGKKAEFAGGIILVIIGIKILVEHLFA